MNQQLWIMNHTDGVKTRDIFEFNSSEETDRWFEQLTTRVNEHSEWKHAAVNFQRFPHSDNSSGSSSARNSFVGDKRQGSLYDETPLIGSYASSELKYVCSKKIHVSVFYPI